jgi:hypothetical protein
VIKTDFKLLITTLIAIALFANITLAVPGIPHAFYGSVTWNGQAAPDGMTVTAKIGGVEVANTTTSGGKYGYPIGCKAPGYPNSFCVDDSNSDRSGSTIAFFVNGVDTGKTAIFCNGCYDLCGKDPTNCTTTFDLSASGGTSPPAPGGSPSGPSGSTGGTTTGNQTTGGTTSQGCQEKWTCSEWSTCVSGVQSRTCTDANNCGTSNNEPFNSQPCTAQERKEAEAQQNKTAPITAFFLGLAMTDWLIAIVSGIIIAVIIIFLAKKRSSKK